MLEKSSAKYFYGWRTGGFIGE